MSVAGTDTILSTQIRLAREQAHRQAGEAIATLREIAAGLHSNAIANRLEQTYEGLHSDTFNLAVVGRFKNGKSTLLNALLGRTTRPVADLTPGEGPMPVGQLPTTAILTSIGYAEQPYVRMWRFDGKHEAWSLARYLREAVVGDDEDEYAARFADIRQFEMGFPAELCQAGITLIDTPGTDDVPRRTQVTSQALDSCDAAIVVYRSDALAGEDERGFGAMVLASGTRVFSVVNLMHDTAVDERLRRHAWNRVIALALGGPKYEGQDPATHNLYFVHALKAQRGKAAGDPQLVADSGLACLEGDLARFLLTERANIHLQKYIKVADKYGAEIAQQLSQRRAAIEQDMRTLQQEYARIQPELATIRARPDKLPRLVAMYRRDAAVALKESFATMVTQLRRDLPQALARRSLPTAGRFIAPWQGKQVSKEAADACNEIIMARLEVWKNAEAPRTLEPIFERLLGEVSREIEGIEREFDKLHLRLTGWSLPMGQSRSLVSMQERLITSLLGVIMFDPATVMGAATSGLRGLAGNLAGQMTATLILVVLGVGGMAVAPALLVGAVLGSLAGGGLGLEKRIKDNVYKQVVDPGLQQAPELIAPLIEAEVEQQFAQIEAQLLREVRAMIADQEHNIAEMVELNQRSQANKTAARAEVDRLHEQVDAQRTLLARAGVAGMQVA